MNFFDKIVKIKFSQTLELKNAAEKFEYMNLDCENLEWYAISTTISTLISEMRILTS